MQTEPSGLIFSKVCSKQRALNILDCSAIRVGSYNIEFMDVVVFALGRFWFAHFKMGGNILVMILSLWKSKQKKANKILTATVALTFVQLLSNKAPGNTGNASID